MDYVCVGVFVWRVMCVICTYFALKEQQQSSCDRYNTYQLLPKDVFQKIYTHILMANNVIFSFIL